MSVAIIDKHLTTHFAAWADELTQEQIGAVVDWQSPRHAIMNELVRARVLDPAKAREMENRLGAEELYEVMEASRLLAEACSLEILPFDVTVYRGVDSAGYAEIIDHLGYARLHEGDIIVDAGFLATSIYEEMAKSRMGAPPNALLLELRAPKGKAAAWVPSVHQAGDQGELLFAPMTTLEVKKVRKLGQDHGARADIWVQ